MQWASTNALRLQFWCSFPWSLKLFFHRRDQGDRPGWSFGSGCRFSPSEITVEEDFSGFSLIFSVSPWKHFWRICRKVQKVQTLLMSVTPPGALYSCTSPHSAFSNLLKISSLIFLLAAMDWIVSLQNFYVETLTSDVTVLRDRAFRR